MQEYSIQLFSFNNIDTITLHVNLLLLKLQVIMDIVFILGESHDMFWYAQTLYLTGQYHRAAHVLTTRELDKVNISVDNVKTL